MPGEGVDMQFTVDGFPRKALVFAPAAMPDTRKHPLVFALHGHGGQTKTTAIQMGIQNLWPQAIVVYPQGLNRTSPVDPTGQRPGWQVEENQSGGVGNQDLHFFDQMLTKMEQQYVVDRKRIYATGFSNGAIFSYLLWAERGEKLAAIGECAGRLWPSEHLTLPRPLLAIAGESDATDPFALQQGTIEAAPHVDHATGPGHSCGQYCTLYASAIHAPVKTFIHPDGHVYPAWAPHEIVTFFKAHTLP